MIRDKKLFLVFSAAIILKLALFAFIAHHSPQSKLETDSHAYLQTAETLDTYGVFARHRKESGIFPYEMFRTPGYPAFLTVFHHWLKIPLNGIIVLHILLTALAAFFTYKTARTIDERLGFLSAVIILFDPPITAYSFMILTESLFLLTVSVFMYLFVSYLKNSRLSALLLAAVFIAIGVYVRPVGYFLAVTCAGFILFTQLRTDWKKALAGSLILLLIVHTFLGIWQYRNYRHTRNAVFSDIHNATVESPDATGLWKSYSRNQDPKTQDLSAPLYYANVTFRCLLSLMTRPGTFKYFDIEPLKVAAKIIGYPWMVFWLAGLLFGLSRIRHDPKLQFMFLMIAYFAAVTIVATMWGANERFRVPMMPFIAILSAAGWKTVRRPPLPSFFKCAGQWLWQKRMDIVALAGIFFFLFMAYLPVFTIPYAHHDDYFFWMWDKTDVHPLHFNYLSSGRYLGAIFTTIIWTPVESLSGISGVRAVNLLNIGLAGFLIYLSLQPFLRSLFNAFLFTVLVLTLPPFQVIVAWASCLNLSIAIFLSSLSAYLRHRSFSTRDFRRKIILDVLSVTLFFSALATHQLAAMFYWAVTAAVLLAHNQDGLSQWIKRLLYISVPAFMTMGFYFILLLSQYETYKPFMVEMYDPYHLTTDIWGKLIWFMTEPLSNTVNLWNIFPSMVWTKIFFTVLFFAVGFLLLRDLRDALDGNSLKPFLSRLSLMALTGAALLILGYFPHLVTTGTYTLYRSSVVIIVLCMLFLLWLVRKYLLIFRPDKRPYLLTGLLLISCFYGYTQAYDSVQYHFALPNNLQMTFAKNNLQKVPLKEYENICVIFPPDESLPFPRRGDEYGATVPNYFQDIGGFVYGALSEAGKLEEAKRLEKESRLRIAAGWKNSRCPEGKTFIVDLGDLYKSREYGQFLKR